MRKMILIFKGGYRPQLTTLFKQFEFMGDKNPIAGDGKRRAWPWCRFWRWRRPQHDPWQGWNLSISSSDFADSNQSKFDQGWSQHNIFCQGRIFRHTLRQPGSSCGQPRTHPLVQGSDVFAFLLCLTLKWPFIREADVREWQDRCQPRGLLIGNCNITTIPRESFATQ